MGMQGFHLGWDSLQKDMGLSECGEHLYEWKYGCMKSLTAWIQWTTYYIYLLINANRLLDLTASHEATTEYMHNTNGGKRFTYCLAMMCFLSSFKCGVIDGAIWVAAAFQKQPASLDFHSYCILNLQKNCVINKQKTSVNGISVETNMGPSQYLLGAPNIIHWVHIHTAGYCSKLR